MMMMSETIELLGRCLRGVNLFKDEAISWTEGLTHNYSRQQTKKRVKNILFNIQTRGDCNPNCDPGR